MFLPRKRRSSSLLRNEIAANFSTWPSTPKKSVRQVPHWAGPVPPIATHEVAAFQGRYFAIAWGPLSTRCCLAHVGGEDVRGLGLMDKYGHSPKDCRIRSSTRASTGCGMARPRSLAVFRFDHRFELRWRSMDRSPGFAPLRILSTWWPRRNLSTRVPRRHARRARRRPAPVPPEARPPRLSARHPSFCTVAYAADSAARSAVRASCNRS